MKNRSQRVVTTVEFAIIGAAMMLVLFGVIEVARAIYVTNALAESTRRAARMATVCPVNDPAIAQVALFNAPGESGPGVIGGGLTEANFETDYLDASGAVLPDPTASFAQIVFVRTRVVNFQHRMLIPFASYIFTTPSFATTLRRESLGVPRDGVVTPC
jgi:Flp pilus assembly protein TadG